MRKPSSGSEINTEEVIEEERNEVDEHEATYLTTQPSMFGQNGEKMRQYQLEGLNWMIRLQENGVSTNNIMCMNRYLYTHCPCFW